MKKQYLTQVIISEHRITANPMWTGYGAYAHKIPTASIQTYLCQRLSTSDDLYSSDDLKQYINRLTGTVQRTKGRI